MVHVPRHVVEAYSYKRNFKDVKPAKKAPGKRRGPKKGYNFAVKSTGRHVKF